MFRILDLTLINFKGFKEAKISFSKPRTILGGPNGFGKTSIFDALELLFTGKIERMQVYKPGHDNRSGLNDDYKPLVYDTAIAEIVIEATLQLSEQRELIVRRSAEQRLMKNPVDFGAFSPIQYWDSELGMYKDCETNPSFSAFFASIASQYSFLNYLTQEEANRFLKCKEQERKQQINSLFQTEVFDEPISKLSSVRSEVKAEALIIENDITQLTQDIERLQATPLKNANNCGATEYVQFFGFGFDWDKQEPLLSYEGFNSILKEGGVLDDLQYYARFESTYKWSLTNNTLNEILQPDNLDNLTLWLKWKDLEKALSGYDDYLNGFRKKWEELSLTTIQSFSLDFTYSLPEGILGEDTISEMNRSLSSQKNIVKSTGDLQRSYADLLGSRNVTEKTLVDIEPDVGVLDCPLCGSHYETKENLMRAIQFHGVQLSETLNQISLGMSSLVEDFKESVGKRVIIPIDNYYHSLGIETDVVTAYKKLNKQLLEDYYDFLAHQLSFPKDIGKDQQVSKSIISAAIVKWQIENAEEMPTDYDFMRMQKIHNSYGRYLLPGILSQKNIEKKRQYLTNSWNASVSQLMKEKTSKIAGLKKQLDRLSKREKLLKRTIDKIKERRDSYLSTMVSQIETLFYIYTGRIMQDNYYGRGCYLKYNQKNSVVLFTSGSFTNEVDALYKMSSGQLVSISIAFLLTINKLYADNAIIAIDDPIQTIDDLNLWGLMETIRHDFKDSSILLSTHERDYGVLLTDKFNKVGLQTEYIDMSSLHTVQKESM